MHNDFICEICGCKACKLIKSQDETTMLECERCGRAQNPNRMYEKTREELIEELIQLREELKICKSEFRKAQRNFS